LDSEILYLFSKYINNQCNERELNAVIELLKAGKYEQELDFVLTNEVEKKMQPDLFFSDDPEDVALLQKIQNTITEKAGNKKSRLQIDYKKYAIAAMLLIASGLTFYLYPYKKSQTTKSAEVYTKDIAPGSNKAYLTLANGKRIALTDADDGALAFEQNVEITKTNDGQLIYQAKENNTQKLTNTQYNKIEIPKGGQYQLRLPDGTKVWLNAATTLKYPVSFSSAKERRVELNGEAYFEVTHNKNVPFRVVTGKQVIEVLGTHFNVNSYTDEPTIETTLLEGSVKVSSTQKSNNLPSAIIKPGEQASFSGHKINISPIDIDEVMAWKNGDFIFKNKDFKTTMRSIARWYDVDIVYEDNIPIDMQPGGWVSRKNNISAVLEMIESTGKVHFKIEGRRIIVKK